MTGTSTQTQWGKVLLVLAAIAAVMGAMVLSAAPARATTTVIGPIYGDNACRDVSDGAGSNSYDTVYDPGNILPTDSQNAATIGTWAYTAPAHLVYTAPTGTVVTELCIKAGSGYEVWQFSPGLSVADVTHTINNQNDKNPQIVGISHFGVKLSAATTTTGSTTSTTSSSSTTSTSSTTTTTTSTTTTTTSTTTTTQPVDVCLNVDGIQESVPDGYYADGGNCYVDETSSTSTTTTTTTTTTTLPTDVCSNIEGDQATVPDGYFLVEGECLQDSTLGVSESDTPTPTLTEVTLAATGADGTTGGVALALSLVLGGLGVMLLRRQVNAEI